MTAPKVGRITSDEGGFSLAQLEAHVAAVTADPEAQWRQPFDDCPYCAAAMEAGLWPEPKYRHRDLPDPRKPR